MSPVYDTARTTAFVLIAVWPFGMPILTILLMMYTRRALLAKRGTFWTRALGFLHREYRPECFWWEVTHCATSPQTLPSGPRPRQRTAQG